MLRRNRSLEGSGQAAGAQQLPRTSRTPPLAPASARVASNRRSARALQAQEYDEERYSKLVQGRKGVPRDAMCQALNLELSQAFLTRFYEVMKVDPEVDLATFQRVVRLLEGPSLLERQRVAFRMFDPQSQTGRITKNEFRKVTYDLLCGSSARLSQLSSSSSSQAVAKPLVQCLTDAVFSIYCSDELKGMDFNEWLAFANEDPETLRLIATLDQRIRVQDLGLRRRFNLMQQAS